MSKIKAKVVTKPNPQIKSNSTQGKNIKTKLMNFKDKQNRSQIFQIISDNTSLTKSQVEQVFDELNKLIEGHLKKKGPGEFVIPKVGIKLRRIKKKPTKERLMHSPLIGKEVTINAKPARMAVKLTALKGLKDLVNK